MITKITDSKWGLSITLIPQSVEDTALLLRFTNNVKLKKPIVGINFEESISCNIYLNKLDPKVQQNYINEYTRKR